MKKILVSVFVLLLLASCESMNDSSDSLDEGQEIPQTPSIQESPTEPFVGQSIIPPIQDEQDQANVQSDVSEIAESEIADLTPLSPQNQNVSQTNENPTAQREIAQENTFDIQDDPEVEFFPNALNVENTNDTNTDLFLEENDVAQNTDQTDIGESSPNINDIQLQEPEFAQAIPLTTINEDDIDESALNQTTDNSTIGEVTQSFIPLTEDGEVESVALPFDTSIASDEESEVIDFPEITQAPVIETPFVTEPIIQESPEVDEIIIPEPEPIVTQAQERDSYVNDRDANFSMGIQEANDFSFEDDIDEQIIFTPLRHVQVFKGDYTDIFLPGQGWIFLGEVEQSDPSIYDFEGRNIDDGDTSFTFQGKDVGTTDLHFYKQDIIENVYIDEYIRLSVLSEDAIMTSDNADASVMFDLLSDDEILMFDDESMSESSIENQEDLSLLDLAQVAYEEKRYADSLALLDEFSITAVSDIDRALYLYGQNYEANSDQRNIKRAYDSYQRLVEFYPQSSYWEDAAKRRTYLERFYFTIN